MEDLIVIARQLATPGKGILAADESVATCGKRLEKAGLENTEENRRAYREVLLTAKLGASGISGVILFKETLYQKAADGRTFVSCLTEQGVYPGVKVDEGLQPLEGGLEGETVTKGLESLRQAAAEFVKAGAVFAKWRATIKIQDSSGPSDLSIARNADDLAQYAKICQECGLVPIVEPEILIDGSHSIERFQQVTEKVLSATFSRLHHHGVVLEATLLKPQMVIQGADSSKKAEGEEIAARTLAALKRTVPPAIPGVLFLSGGQTEEEATINLNAINKLARADSNPPPWSLSFSFGRALQHSVLKLWSSDKSKASEAQELASLIAKVNSLASLGQYQGPHPSTADQGTLRETFRGMY